MDGPASAWRCGCGPRTPQVLHDRLAQHGVTILTEPVDGPFGRTFTLRDSDGYAITIHDAG
jgi:predicted enzyme related to lactoylglutathione lyase